MNGSENFTSTVTIHAGGQMILPEEIQHLLALKEGNKVRFSVIDGRICLEAVPEIKLEAEKDSDEIFVPDYDNLLSFGKCLTKCTIC